jgi:hypothetical protein
MGRASGVSSGLVPFGNSVSCPKPATGQPATDSGTSEERKKQYRNWEGCLRLTVAKRNFFRVSVAHRKIRAEGLDLQSARERAGTVAYTQHKAARRGTLPWGSGSPASDGREKKKD